MQQVKHTNSWWFLKIFLQISILCKIIIKKNSKNTKLIKISLFTWKLVFWLMNLMLYYPSLRLWRRRRRTCFACLLWKLKLRKGNTKTCFCFLRRSNRFSFIVFFLFFFFVWVHFTSCLIAKVRRGRQSITFMCRPPWSYAKLASTAFCR